VALGYPFAIFLMLASAALPYLYSSGADGSNPTVFAVLIAAR